MAGIYILFYFVVIVIILLSTKVIAIRLAHKGYSLDRIKKTIWNFVYASIAILSVISVASWGMNAGWLDRNIAYAMGAIAALAFLFLQHRLKKHMK